MNAIMRVNERVPCPSNIEPYICPFYILNIGREREMNSAWDCIGEKN